MFIVIIPPYIHFELATFDGVGRIVNVSLFDFLTGRAV